MNELREKIVRLPCSLDIDQVNEVCECCVPYFQKLIDKLGNPYEYGSNGRDHSRSAGFENCRQQLKEALK